MAATSSRRKIKRVVTDAVVNITSTFNNTIVVFADQNGNVLAWATTGSSGFKGARKGTPYAAQITTENAARQAQEIGVQNVDVRVRGVGAGRDSSIRALNNLGFRVTSITDVTSLPHNGCRAPKRRRV